MKNWHLWHSTRMPPGGTVAQSPGFLNGPRSPRIPRAGKDNQQFFPTFPGHWQVAVPNVCLPSVSGGTGRGGVPLALWSYGLPIAALGLLWDVLHPGEIWGVQGKVSA